MFKRRLELSLPKNKSAFLLGPRQVGKSTFLKKHFPHSLYFDLLDTKNFIKYKNEPWLLTEELQAQAQSQPQKLLQPIIIDEIQKVPLLLNEAHRLIEDEGWQFILCGSSARKLRKGGINLLGGRARKLTMHPLVFPEIKIENKNFDLLQVLNQGKIPNHLLSESHQADLSDYISLYLKEEILAEGLTRNLPAFTKFLEAASFSNSEILNYTNVASDVSVSAKTIKAYYQVLTDTLIGHLVMPFKPRRSRVDVVSSPKFYFFDTGVAQALRGVELTATKGEAFGHSFEHFVFTELLAYSSYSQKNYEISYWRTRSGAEVDFILNKGKLAIEVKSSRQVLGKDLRGIYQLQKEHQLKQTIVVTNEDQERMHNGILLLPYKIFLQRLWGGELI